MISEQQYKDACAQRDAAEKVIQDYHREKTEQFNERWNRFVLGEAYSDDDLVYASHCRCKKCGAGMAYPKGCSPFNQWTCSDVLKNVGSDTGHDALPFTMFEVKSEDQPSANGATTRPPKPSTP